MCDGTFYKQSRVEKSANEACRKAYVPDGKFIPKNPWALFFKKTLVPYPGPRDLFPDVPERGVIISMTRINKGFFSPQRLGTFLRIRKKDFVVFGENCKTLGIVRQFSRDQFVKCEEIKGGPAENKAPQPKTP